MVNTQSILFGLILVGGKSTRMKKDKSTLKYHDKPQAAFCYDLLSKFCDKIFISCRKDQKEEISIKDFPHIIDKDEFADIGPLGGVLSAMQEFPNRAWLVLACDLPYVNEATLLTLIKCRDSKKIATAYVSVHDNLPEPLCAIYETHSSKNLLESFHSGIKCPRKILINSDAKLLQQNDKMVLENINTPEEYKAVKGHLKSKS